MWLRALRTFIHRHLAATQLFINFGDNSASLDKQGFSPIGEVVEGGMAVVERVYAGYREKPEQGQIRRQGNMYLNSIFGNLSFITSVAILPQQVEGEDGQAANGGGDGSQEEQDTGEDEEEREQEAEEQEAPR